jgi:hypothetical protein
MPESRTAVPHRRRCARAALRLRAPVAAFVLMALLSWTGARFQLDPADPLDTANNSFVAAGIRQWGGFPAVTAVNPFEGLGSLFMPLNPWIAPHDAPIEPVNNFADPFKATLAHRPFARHPVLWLAWCFGGVYLLARALRAGPLVAALCAQAAALVALPPFNSLFFKGSLSLAMNPPLVIPVGLCLALLAVFSRSRPATVRSAAGLALALFGLGLATLWSDPLFAALFLVTLLPFFAASLLPLLPAAVAAGRRERPLRSLLLTPVALKLAAAAVPLIALKLAGPLDFLSVLARYTARQHFPGEIHGEMQTADFTVFPLGNPVQTALAVALAAGCLACVVLRRGQARVLAGAALLHLSLLTAAELAYLNEWFPWRYPLPLYLEIPSLPVYVVCAVCGFAALGRQTLAAARARFPAAHRRFPGRAARRALPALVPALALGALLALIGDVAGIWRLLVAEPLVELSSPERLAYLPDRILDLMRRQVRLQPGAAFRGRAASVVGVAGDGVVSVVDSMRKDPFNKWYWYDIQDQLGVVAAPDFSGTPWTTGIPTVAEYSHLISPPYYYFFSRLLNRRGDFQSRNLLWPTVANVEALAAMGVRYLVTDTRESNPRLRLRGRSPVAGAGPGVLLHLYETRDPNLGAYSPTTVTVIRGGRGTIDRLRAPDFDWRREAVLGEPLAGPLVPLERLELRFLPNAVHVEASSPGRSLALLPIEFSRCWAADDPAVRLVRADLVMTGLLFEGRVSTTIRFRFGLFDPWRRLRDLDELRELDLAPDGWVPYPDFISALPVPRAEPGTLTKPGKNVQIASRGRVPKGAG